MQKKFRVIAAVLALLMALGAAGCSAINNPPVGKVGDVDLTYSAYSSAFQNVYQYYEYGAYDDRVQDKDRPLPELREIAFEVLVDAMIPAAMARKNGMTLTAEEEAEIDASLQTTIQESIDNSAKDLDETSTDAQKLSYFKKVLKQNGYTYDSYTSMVREGLVNEKLGNKIKEEVESTAVADEEVMKKWYEEELKVEQENYPNDLSSYYQAKQYYSFMTGVPPLYNPEGFTYVKQILIAAPAEGETKDVAGIVAEVQKKIDAGEDFDALIAEYNEDTGVESNPDGYLFADAIAGQYAAEFSEAASKLKIGEISGPVETQYGTHFLYKTGEVPSSIVPYDDIVEEIRAYTLTTAKEDIFNEAIEKWRGELEIKTYPQRVSTVGQGMN